MNRKQKPAPQFQGSCGEDGVSLTPAAGPGLCITVIPTTEEGTAAALRAARGLAKDLDATITLLKMEVVPTHFPLYRPPGSLHCTIMQQHSLVLQSGAREEDVAIRIRLCRDLENGLRRVLRRRALVVIGGRRHWWLSGEERLEKSLRRLGHHVIFIDVDDKADLTSRSRFPFSPSSGAARFQSRSDAAGSFFGREAL
jgi:hypothetical protein